MLDARGAKYTYRDYTRNTLSEDEIREVVAKLGLPASALLRSRDKAYKEHQLDGSESDDLLVPLMAAHPTLMQRPIGVTGTAARIGRPPEQLLDLLD